MTRESYLKKLIKENGLTIKDLFRQKNSYALFHIAYNVKRGKNRKCVS